MTGGLRPVRALLRVPLYFKIVLANALLTVAGAAGVFIACERIAHGESGVLPAAIVVGSVLAAGILVNAVLVRVALSPLDQLERAAARVRAGDLDARAELSAVADPELARLARTFNAMLDGLRENRRRMREMARRAQSAMEEERKRISLELHDETAQTLAALLLRLRVARTAREPELRDTLLEETRTEISRALEGIRRYAQGLRPPALDMLGLAQAIEGHARELAQLSGLAIEVAAEPVRGALSYEAELAVYRIVQEALSNAVRHAGAARVMIRLSREGEVVRAEVEDDGRGFDPERPEPSASGGLGLFGMRERAAYVGGTVHVDSRPGRGTRVLVEIPTMEAEGHV